MLKLRGPAVASLALGLPALLYVGIGTGEQNAGTAEPATASSRELAAGGQKTSISGNTQNTLNCAMDESRYNICVDSNGFHLNHASAVEAALDAAKNKWESVVVGHLPGAGVPATAIDHHFLCSTYPMFIDDSYVCVRGLEMDGRGGVLADASTIYLRALDELPVVGVMKFDNADVPWLEEQNGLLDVIAHELGHVLGMYQGLLDRKGATSNGLYVGVEGVREWHQTYGCDNTPPIERDYGEGTAFSNWNEEVMGAELMTEIYHPGTGTNSPLSRLTVGVMADLGYAVDYDKADPFTVQCPVPLPTASGRRRLQAEREPRLLQAAGGAADAPPRHLSPTGKSKAKAHGAARLRHHRRIIEAAATQKGGIDKSVIPVADMFIDVVYIEYGHIYAVQVTESDM